MYAMSGVVKKRFGRGSATGRGRTLRQRWRWVPLPMRLRFAQLRSRWMHRRRIVQLIGAAVFVPILAVSALGGSGNEQTPRAGTSPVISIPDDHRVLSLPIDERVPPLEPGDRVDLYLTVDGFAGTTRDITQLEDVGTVVSTDEASFSLAISDVSVGVVAEAVGNGGVLVVRR